MEENTSKQEVQEMTEAQKQARIAFMSGHYPYFMQALVIAMQRTLAWTFIVDGTQLNAKDMYDLGVYKDSKQPLEDGYFYMISVEGAIGVCPGKEYMTSWLFIPMDEGEEKEKVLARMKESVEVEDG